MRTDYCEIDFSAVEFGAMRRYLEQMHRQGWALCQEKHAPGTPGRLVLSFIRPGQGRLPH